MKRFMGIIFILCFIFGCESYGNKNDFSGCISKSYPGMQLTTADDFYGVISYDEARNLVAYIKKSIQTGEKKPELKTGLLMILEEYEASESILNQMLWAEKWAIENYSGINLVPFGVLTDSETFFFAVLTDSGLIIFNKNLKEVPLGASLAGFELII